MSAGYPLGDTRACLQRKNALRHTLRASFVLLGRLTKTERERNTLAPRVLPKARSADASDNISRIVQQPHAARRGDQSVSALASKGHVKLFQLLHCNSTERRNKPYLSLLRRTESHFDFNMHNFVRNVPRHQLPSKSLILQGYEPAAGAL